MRYLFVFILFFYSFSASAQERYKEATKTIKHTSSYKISDSISLHFAVTYKKNPLRYEYQAYLVGEMVKKLAPFSFDGKKKPNIIASHINDSKCVFIYKRKNNYYIIEYDFKDEKASLSQKIPDLKYDHILQKENATFFIKKKGKSILLTHIRNKDYINTRLYDSETSDDANLFNKFKLDTEFDYVTTDEYVEIGSIKKGHSYIFDNTIILTYDEKSKETSYVITLDYANKSNFSVRSYKNSLKNIRQIRSFAIGNLLFQFAISFKLAKLNIYNLEASNLSKSFTYTKEDFGPHNKYYRRTKEMAVKPAAFFNSFARFVPFSTYLPTIFITVNKGINDSYIVESGHINGAVYSYYNHFDHFMWHQQMMNQPPVNIPRFGPNPNLDIYEVKDTEDDLKKTSFILALDTDFQKLDSIPDSLFEKEKWKKEKESLDEIKKNPGYKSFSTIELQNSLRYIFYHKRIKTLFIKEINKKE